MLKNEVFIAFRKTTNARSDKATNSVKQSEGKRRGIEPHISFGHFEKKVQNAS